MERVRLYFKQILSLSLLIVYFQGAAQKVYIMMPVVTRAGKYFRSEPMFSMDSILHTPDLLKFS